jgi:hypothetical protein
VRDLTPFPIIHKLAPSPRGDPEVVDDPATPARRVRGLRGCRLRWRGATSRAHLARRLKPTEYGLAVKPTIPEVEVGQALGHEVVDLSTADVDQSASSRMVRSGGVCVVMSTKRSHRVQSVPTMWLWETRLFTLA